MTLRLMSALCILLLAGCAASEPQTISPTSLPGSPLTPALAGQPIGETGQVPAGETMGAATAQHGYNCRTVGNATLCDAPAVPSSQDTLYTN